MKTYNVLYKGRKIYTNISTFFCADILQDFAERFYSGEDTNPNLIELEEI